MHLVKTNQIAILDKKKPGGKKPKTLGKLNEPRGLEVRYRRELLAIVSAMKKYVNQRIIPLVRSFEREYMADDYGEAIQQALEEFSSRFLNIEEIAAGIAASSVFQVVRSSRSKLLNRIKRKTGKDIFSPEPDMDSFLRIKIAENVSLIKSIPEQYSNKLNTIIYEGITKDLRASDIAKSIRELSGVTERRAKFIARDQVAKLNSQITTKRMEALGIKKYIWRTSKDERVRGRPGGLYPNARPSHWAREGKIFRIDKPPAGGHPGEDYGCRCEREAIIQE